VLDGARNKRAGKWSHSRLSWKLNADSTSIACSWFLLNVQPHVGNEPSFLGDLVLAIVVRKLLPFAFRCRQYIVVSLAVWKTTPLGKSLPRRVVALWQASSVRGGLA
jgi:hypothetical protein